MNSTKQKPFGWFYKGHFHHFDPSGWASPDFPVVALYRELPQPKQEPLTNEQKDILNFLLGASDIDGAWFSDKHPTEAGQFWWRNRLRKAFQEADHGIEENT